MYTWKQTFKSLIRISTINSAFLKSLNSATSVNYVVDSFTSISVVYTNEHISLPSKKKKKNLEIFKKIKAPVILNICQVWGFQRDSTTLLLLNIYFLDKK